MKFCVVLEPCLLVAGSTDIPQDGSSTVTFAWALMAAMAMGRHGR